MINKHNAKYLKKYKQRTNASNIPWDEKKEIDSTFNDKVGKRQNLAKGLKML